MRRDLFTEDHEAFRELARNFIEKEVVPVYPEWEKGGRMPRAVFKQMGALGMLGMRSDEGDHRQIARSVTGRPSIG
jgi:acyl-CoA dehydrogenase